MEPDQSDLDNLRLSDLQGGTVVPDDATCSISMKHQMGLAQITLKQKTVPVQTITDSNGGGKSTQGSTSVNRNMSNNSTTTVTATNVFTGDNRLWLNGSVYQAIVKPNTGTLYMSSETEIDTWKENITANVPAGECVSYEAESRRTKTGSYTGSFYYSKSVLTVTLPFTATYTMQAWGAKGGYYNSNGNDIGGNGGDAKGSITLTEGTEVYICCGGRRTGGESQGYDGGYNGGGYDQDPGGGATHIAYKNNRGELKNYKDYQDEVLICGGGGGGADTGDAGGTGGGEKGGNSQKGYGKGGTQTSGGAGYSGYTASYGSFGQGGGTPDHTSGGGGGGWYGGGSSTVHGDYGGGGGSGHIGTGVTFISWSNGTCDGYGHATITASF